MAKRGRATDAFARNTPRVRREPSQDNRGTGAAGADARTGGVLFLVSTPIGNLKDITLRAIETLGSVDLIAAEDTRRAGILLTEYGITRPVTSYHDHTESKKLHSLISQIARGKRVAVISEAGSPGISDPCYRLAQAALEKGIPVVPIPGPTAVIPALVVSGLPVDRFVFEGFLPPRNSARRKRLAALRREPRTMVFYEAPHRLASFLGDLADVLGDRNIAVVRELTKTHEEVLRGPSARLAEFFRNHEPRGEFVVVCEGARGSEEEEEDPERLEWAERQMEWLLTERRVAPTAAAREVARASGLPRRVLYKRAVEISRARKLGRDDS